jgi:hypothetical protein
MGFAGLPRHQKRFFGHLPKRIPAELMPGPDRRSHFSTSERNDDHGAARSCAAWHRVSPDTILVASESARLVAGCHAVNWTMAKADTVIGSLNDLTAPRAPMRGDFEAAIRDLAASAS